MIFLDVSIMCSEQPLSMYNIGLGGRTDGHARESAGGNDSARVVGGDDIDARTPKNMVLGNEDSDKDKLGKEMLRYCKGLPLAIVVLGGILRNKESVNEWDVVHKNISSYLRRGYDHGRSYIEVLVQSYNDLPYHLKPCFLHLANFPEDYEIYTERLYWMWMAEGLVTWSRDRIAGTETLEDVANEYLCDLAQAGMVQIVKQTSNGRIKSIRVHDLMRDVCLQKATSENFLNIIDHRKCIEKPLNVSSYFSHKRLHRMAIFSADGVNSFIPDSLHTNAHKHLRSLLLITEGHEVHRDKCQEFIKHICTEFQWLRVLDLERLCLRGGLTNQFRNLVHLRYLSLKETKVSEVPSCIGKLRFLQILDLRITTHASVRLPNTLWKLGELRHLLLPSGSYEIAGLAMLRVDTLIFLERLENLEVGKFEPIELLELNNLRRLSIKEKMSEECVNIIRRSPALKSGCLKSCSFDVKGEVVTSKPDILSDLDCTHRLKMVGKITGLIKSVVFPRCLRVLSLEFCELKEDPMRILGSLSHLRDLILGIASFVGKKIICETQSFLKLKMFCLQGLMSLENWILGEGSMSKLVKLKIKQCATLKKIPEGLPISVHLTCSPCVPGIEKYGTCIFHKTLSLPVASYQRNFMKVADHPTSWLETPLTGDVYKKVVLCGQGGLGRSTTVKVLYDSRGIHEHFEAIAWACPTWSCENGFLRRMFQGLLMDLNPQKLTREDLSRMSSSKLIDAIQQTMQQKKCLVILLNLENVNHHLLYLDETFGSQGFENGSKLLITTSDGMFTSMDNEVLVLDLQHPRESNWSWSFLQNRLKAASVNKVSVASFSSGRGLVRQCSANPLSLVMLGGLLAMKDTLTDWGAMDSPEMKKLPQVFDLCYDELPHHLSRCLLFLSIFPEDSETTTKKMYQMWIAAGLVQLEDDHLTLIGESFEVTAEGYLAELVQRGMIKVGKRGPTGKIKTCRLQFALQDLCLEKARGEQFLTVVGQSEISALASSDRDFSHLAIHLNENISSLTSLEQQLGVLISSLHSLSSLSSLLFSPNVNDPSHKIEAWDWFINICNQFKLLQVLDLEGMWMTKGSLPKEVGMLVNLRYLSLKETWVSKLPQSIEKLTKLQTLDLRVRNSIFIPNVLWKLEHLRNLYFPDFIDQQSPKLQLSDHLRTLVNLETDKVQLDPLPNLKSVRIMSIRKIHAVKELDDILSCLSRSVDLTMNSEIINNAHQNILSSFQNLHKVRIKGAISVPLRPEMFPVHLEELTLKHTNLQQDPIPVLEKLHELRSLYFDHQSFLGKKMSFSKDSHALTHLKFCSLINLEHLESPENGMPNLESTVIRDCWRLKEENLPINDPQYRTIEI